MGGFKLSCVMARPTTLISGTAQTLADKPSGQVFVDHFRASCSRGKGGFP